MKRYFLDTEYGQIHYVVDGAGDPVILLHQSPFSLDEYKGVMPILGRKCQVIAVDTLGYGESDKPSRQPSMEDYAKTVVMLMDKLALKKASLVGHHTGAFIAIEVAAAHPERVDKLVLSGPIYTDGAMRKKGLKMFENPWEIKEDASHITDQWKYFKEHDPLLSPILVNKMTLDWLKAGTPYSTWGYIAVFSYPVDKRLPLITCPTLILYGTDDLITWGFPEESVLKVGKAIFRSNTVSIEGGTYAVAERMPEEFSRPILEFLGI